MGKCGFNPLVLAVAGSVLWGGCRAGSAARIRSDVPKQDAPKVAGVADDVGGLKAYLAEGAPLRRTFLQVDLGRKKGVPRAYDREVQPQWRVEGSLIGRVEFPLGQYLDPHSRGGARPQLAWPTAHGKRLDTFFVEFKPAIMEWPVEAREGKSVEARAQITAFEFDGVPFANGTCRRTMRVAGFESVSAGRQTFDDAVRMEADTELAFGWMATIRVHETAWFARGVGLVRREERFNGRALWLFRFQSAGGYEIADEVRERVETAAEEVGESVKGEKSLKSAGSQSLKSDKGDATSETLSGSASMLSRLAICFERTGRRIRVTGLAVEWTQAISE